MHLAVISKDQGLFEALMAAGADWRLIDQVPDCLTAIAIVHVYRV